jgi:hypothetical protein
MVQDLYPDHQVDVELSDGDNNRRKESAGNDAEDKGAPLAEPTAPNLISSNAAGQTHPSAADRVDTTTASGIGHKRKHALLAYKCKPSKSSADQVMTQIELSPYSGSRRPPDLVVVKIILGISLKLFDTHFRPLGLGHLLVMTPNLQRELAHHR